MSDVTQLLSQAEQGDPAAAEQLLPLVYQELRRLAANQLADEKPGQTLQATALVHEAYLRLVAPEQQTTWNSRGHFFVAAAEAMRRSLIESARRKIRKKRGGTWQRVFLSEANCPDVTPPDELLEIDDALSRLALEDEQAASLVKLRFFAGFSITEAAKLLEMSRSTAYEHWAYAKAWLRCELGDTAD